MVDSTARDSVYRNAYVTSRTALDFKREATGWLFAKGRGLWRETVG